MHFQGRYVIQMLKPMHRATKKEETAYRKYQKLLKPMRLCTKDERKEYRTDTHTSILAPGRPSDKDNGLHAPAQLRLARSHARTARHENEDETKPISRLRGIGQAVLTPWARPIGKLYITDKAGALRFFTGLSERDNIPTITHLALPPSPLAGS